MKDSPTNPFTIGVLPRPGEMADRVTELDRIARALSDPGSKLIVYGDRRLGKSATMECAAARVREGGQPVAIVDLSTASGPADAANRILSAVHAEIGTPWRDALRSIAQRLKLGVTFSIPTDGGLPRVGLDLGGAGTEPPEPHRLVPDVLDAIESELASRHTTLGIGLDEFQRIHDWGGTDAEWALRGAMQRHRQIAYVMAGSARSLIEQMIASKDRAFWKLADTMHFAPIDPEVMAEWIVTRADDTGVPFDPGGATLIVALAGPRTRDIVQLARAVWDAADAEGEVATEPDGVRRAFDRLVTEQGALLAKLWSSLSHPAQRVLRAVGAQPGAELTAAETIARYGLGPKSTVYATARRLVDDEVLAEGMTFDDPYFRRWVERHALPDIGLAPPAL
jgi:hypothetical protein